jgi:hypothetical protein
VPVVLVLCKHKEDNDALRAARQVGKGSLQDCKQTPLLQEGQVTYPFNFVGGGVEGEDATP